MSSNTSGVQKKILAKIEALNTLGALCEGVSLSNNISEEKVYKGNYKIIPYKYTEAKYFNTTKMELAKFKALRSWLEMHHKNYDVIVFRYPLASFGLWKLTKKISNKIVFEHNTQEIEELEIICEKRKNKVPNIFRPWYILYRFEVGSLPLITEKYLAPSIFKNALMGLAVTKEIVEYEKNRSINYIVKLVTNAIDVNNCQLRKFSNFNGKVLKMFMLIGHDAEWHGVDRLINSLSKYSGDVKIEIDFFGSINQKNVDLVNHYNLNTNIRFIESIPYNDLDKSLDTYHLGVGAFGAKRKGLTEGTSLKVREYLARGFGFIYAYNDTDMTMYKEFSPYCLHFPNDESLIDFNKVVDFSKALYKDEFHHIKIRGLAELFLDTKVKMNLMLSYITQEIKVNV